jgi:hypothetical protein
MSALKGQGIIVHQLEGSIGSANGSGVLNGLTSLELDCI